MLGLYADHLFGQAQIGYNLLCKALRKHKLITGDSLMTDYQSPVSSSLVTLKEREQHSRRQWSSYQLNQAIKQVSLQLQFTLFGSSDSPKPKDFLTVGHICSPRGLSVLINVE